MTCSMLQTTVFSLLFIYFFLCLLLLCSWPRLPLFCWVASAFNALWVWWESDRFRVSLIGVPDLGREDSDCRILTVADTVVTLVAGLVRAEFREVINAHISDSSSLRPMLSAFNDWTSSWRSGTSWSTIVASFEHSQRVQGILHDCMSSHYMSIDAYISSECPAFVASLTQQHWFTFSLCAGIQ